MQAIDDGLIPPEVDLTSPAWFDVFYADRVTSPVPIVGSVAAKRAQSYDYRVEWAPGVEPADSAFQPHRRLGAATSRATTTTGGSSARRSGCSIPAQINTRTRAGSRTRRSSTRTTAPSRCACWPSRTTPSGDVTGQARRSIAIVNQLNGLDPDLAQGFPIAMGASVETSPKLADIDGDGVRDIVAPSSDGTLHVFSRRHRAAGRDLRASPSTPIRSTASTPASPACPACPAT